MKVFKSLVIIVLLSVFSMARGQADDSLLDKIDFNDTTLIASDFMWETIAEYITQAQTSTPDTKNQMYMMILAADNVLSRSVTSFPMYQAVYQYLIGGFSELGANMVVDYLVRMPYLEYLSPSDEQRAEIVAISESYQRVKIGMQSPDIQAVTIDNLEFTLSKIEAKNTVILFWSYSCPHCRELVKELGDQVKDYDDIAIVTVCVSMDFKKVKRLLKKAGLKKQYNICDGKGWDSPIVEDFAVDMTPSLLLLDTNKIIIAKPFDIKEIINILEL